MGNTCEGPTDENNKKIFDAEYKKDVKRIDDLRFLADIKDHESSQLTLGKYYYSGYSFSKTMWHDVEDEINDPLFYEKYGCCGWCCQLHKTLETKLIIEQDYTQASYYLSKVKENKEAIELLKKIRCLEDVNREFDHVKANMIIHVEEVNRGTITYISEEN